MDTLEAEELARWSGGEWIGGLPTRIEGIGNDTRSLRANQLFAALKTGRRDGHDFLADAAAAGASGALVSACRPEIGLPQLSVGDVGAALLAMARGYREGWKAKAIGITGSCGKTTCKDILGTLLGSQRTLCTQGNLNNLIGVPMSMLRPEATSADYAVLEAGISEPGEMEQLARTIDPDLVVVTAIGAAHLRDLGTVENIAREKGRLASGARVGSVFIGASAAPYRELLGGSRATVVAPDANLRQAWSYRARSEGGRSHIRQRVEGSVFEFEYEGLGAGLASNVALSLAVALSLGLEASDLQDRLSRWRPSGLRGEWRSLENGVAFVDCYNANPVSMRDSIATFVANTPEDEPRLYLLGCMEELGEQSGPLHEALGRELPFRKDDFLLVIGGEAASVLRGMRIAGHPLDRCVEVSDAAQARERVAAFRGNLLLKGSRRYRLESVLEAIPAEKRPAEGGARC